MARPEENRRETKDKLKKAWQHFLHSDIHVEAFQSFSKR